MMRSPDEPYCLPVPRYPRYLAWLLRLLQRRCKHYALKADVIQGSCGVYALRWCETCGAIWPTIDGTPCGSPRMCEPTWEPRDRAARWATLVERDRSALEAADRLVEALGQATR
jgi:hypothetical protein